ncbi:MAG: T9SS type A sorting domain-containing protein [Candidatus Latescibacteria bacterium]|nr:T9SS type A sorting domain-containing protein [Candidatus Latescibacterota bacterium]NIO28345.1 T9SS type A sorting domain-containing protein [Candidatus Latescibacterota bacterium]NIO55893.1 T9SS type A sorting domain-containing protein [Candidatus Latescibacterota bacterium]NIT01858.1 T9SS type A sorting domain-containing protein [Candidatus Latescibacterota bacterium]
MIARRSLLTLVFVSLACFVSPPAGAQMTIPHDVLGCGGGYSSGSNLRLGDTVGEGVIGVMSIGSTVHEIGFQYVVNRFLDTTIVAVVIAAFDVEYTEEGVKLEWEIGHADGLEGFNVYRARGESEEFKRLNSDLIPAEKGNSYVDNRIRPGLSYTYLIGAVDRDGEFFSPTVMVEVPYRETTLHQNYPNPFNPSTNISFFLAKPANVLLTIYNVKGQRVRTLLNGRKEFGKHTVVWDGRNDQGTQTSSGVYYYRLKAGDRVFTKKLTLLK